MRIPCSHLFASLAFVLPLTVSALTNADIVKMHRAGLAEETILLSIEKEEPNYDTSPDALIELKAAGISEKVVQKIIAPRPAAQTAEAAASPVFLQDFPSIAPALVAPVAGQDYFVRYTFHEENSKHVTTNYARGGLVPINTPVKLVSMSGSKLVLKRLDNGQVITVNNENKYTKKSIDEIARLMLSSERTSLEKLPEEVAAAIRAGEMRKGMTKELVLMTRGYPPAHETPSIDGDRWVYWSSRFVKLTIVFTDGRLSAGRGLY